MVSIVKKYIFFLLLLSICFGQFKIFDSSKSVYASKMWRTDRFGEFQPIIFGASGTVLLGSGTYSPPYFGTLTLSNITATPYSVFYTDASGVLHALTLGTSGYVLKSAGPTGTPYWAVDATGGGAGTDINDLIDDLSGMMYYSYSNGDIYSVGLGVNGTFLESNGTGGSSAPAFRTLGDADIPDTIAIDNITRIIARDINDLTDNSIGRMYYSDGTYHVAGLQLGSAGTVLKSTGATTAPEWGTDLTGSGGAAYADSLTRFGEKLAGKYYATTDTLHLLDINSFKDGTPGYMYYGDNSYQIASVALGLSGTFLKSNGTGGSIAPEFSAIAASNLSDYSSIGMLNQAEIITGNWVNTAYPWRNNEVSDTLTVNAHSSVSPLALHGTNWAIPYTGLYGYGAELSLGYDNHPLFSTGASSAPEFRAITYSDITATAWRMLFTGAGGGGAELTLGAIGTVLKGQGISAAPVFGTFAASELSDYSNVGMLNQAETITGDWVNTAYPWAANEVADNINIDGTGSVDIDALESGTASRMLITDSQGGVDYVTLGAVNTFLGGNGTAQPPSFQTISASYLSDYSNVGMLNQNETITGNWVNTAYPWGVNEIGAVDMDVLEGGTAYSILNANSTGYKEYTPWGAANTFLGGNGTTTEPSFQTLEDSDIPNTITIDGTAAVDMDALQGGTAYSILNAGSTGYKEYTPWGAVNTVLKGQGANTEPLFGTLAASYLSDYSFVAMLNQAETISNNWVNTAYPWRDNEISDTLTIGNYGHVDMDALEGGTAYSVLGVASTGYKEYSPWGAAHTVYMGNGTTTEPSFQTLTDSDIPDVLTVGGTSSVDMDALDGGTAYSILNAGSTGQQDYTAWGAGSTYLRGNGTTTEPSFSVIDPNQLQDGSYGYMYYSYTNGYLLGVALGANGTILESHGTGGGTAPSFAQNIQTINFTVTGSEHIVGSNQDLPGWKVPFDIYVIKVSGFCDAGTVTLNVEERAATTPNTNGTNILYVDLVVDTDQQEATTSSGHPTVEEDCWIVPEITSKTGTPTILSITVKYYKNE